MGCMHARHTVAAVDITLTYEVYISTLINTVLLLRLLLDVYEKCKR